MNYLETQYTVQWEIRDIITHEDSLDPFYQNYRDSKYNIKILWKNGKTTKKSLNIIVENVSVACAIYVSKNNLLYKPDWKCFKKLAKYQKIFLAS